MGKAEKVHLSVAIIVSDTEMQPASARMNVNGQGHSNDQGQRSLGLNIVKVFFS